MYQFGVKLIQGEDERVSASLMDFPTGPRGEGKTAEEAYQDLIAKTADGLTKFLSGGGRPGVIPEGTPAISISLPAPVTPTAAPAAPKAATKGQQIGSRDKGWTWNYSWRNNTISTEG